MKITKEMIQTIYNRAAEWYNAKMGVTPDKIELDCDGVIYMYNEASYCGSCGCYDTSGHITASVEDLNTDITIVIKQEAEKRKREAQEKRLAEIKKRAEEAEKKLKEEHNLYLKLKKQFES